MSQLSALRTIDVPLGHPPVTVWSGSILLDAFPPSAGWRMITEDGPEQGDLVVYDRFTTRVLKRFRRGDWSLCKYGLD